MLMLVQGIEKRILAALGCPENPRMDELSRTRLLALSILGEIPKLYAFCREHDLPREEVSDWLTNYLRGNRKSLDESRCSRRLG